MQGGSLGLSLIFPGKNVLEEACPTDKMVLMPVLMVTYMDAPSTCPSHTRQWPCPAPSLPPTAWLLRVWDPGPEWAWVVSQPHPCH